ncbi:cytochrome c oxidase accessory protein CcoG [Bacteriovoracaceae bacterium]|nr:cytochrome c oxidase accessory protein CcoG [Bacteriovoracaceae bacterium]
MLDESQKIKGSDRLGTTDQSGHRIFLYPEEVHGKWKKYRSAVYFILILVYLILPWLTINGHQAMLIDIPRREFFILGAHFYAHNTPLLFIIILSFILGIGLLTALLGRVWCGWACPQTVFIEGLYRFVETLAEGNSYRRRKRDMGPWNTSKISRKGLKWIMFLALSLVLSHSFLAYFVPVSEFIKIITISPAHNYTLFTIMLMVTGIFLFDFGWFREQFCIIACPYGRLQSVLMDKDSVVVAYDYNRGEPRKGKDGNFKEFADCVNCHKCVQVCPTGIDIRDGTQMECIHCTRCIDVCDEIMTKVNKPTGLIRYTTESNLNKGQTKIIRPRVILYSLATFLLISLGSYIIYQSKSLKMILIRGTKSPYQIIQNPTRGELIVNHYKANLHYRDDKPINLKFSVNNPEVEVVSPSTNINLKAERKKSVPIFFKFKKSILKHEGKLGVKLNVLNGEEILMTKPVTLVGPYD